MDPLLVRVGWALLALSGGVGVVLYLAGWLLIPVDGKDTSTLDDLVGSSRNRWPREVWIAIVVVACIVLVRDLQLAHPDRLRSRRGARADLVLRVLPEPEPHLPDTAEPVDRPDDSFRRPRPPPVSPPAPATPFSEAADAWRRRVQEAGRATPAPDLRPADLPRPPMAAPASATPAPTGEWPTRPTAPTDPAVSDPVPVDELERVAFFASPDPVGLYVEPSEVSAAATPSRRSQARSSSARRLRLVSILILGLTLGGLGLADLLGAPIAPGVYLGAALLVIGLTLVAATWLGRARGILPVGILVLLALLATWVTMPFGTPRVWDRQLSYSTVADLPGTNRHPGRRPPECRSRSGRRDRERHLRRSRGRGSPRGAGSG